jgi:uncharacterized membrane protein
VTWFWFAALASLCWAVVQIVDKTLINRDAPSTNHYLVATGAAALAPVLLMPLPLHNYVTIPYPSVLASGIAAGVCYFIANAFFFRSLLYIDASLSSAGLATIPGITAVMSYLVLGQRLGLLPVTGIVAITAGVVVMSRVDSAGVEVSRPPLKAWVLLGAAILLYVTEYIIEGTIVRYVHALDVFFWTRIGVLACTAILAVANWRFVRDAIVWAFFSSRRVGAFTVSNELLDMLAVASLIAAYSLGPVGLSTAIAYTQAAFVLAITLLVNAVRAGTIPTEGDRPGALRWRVVGLGVVLVGVFMTSAT